MKLKPDSLGLDVEIVMKEGWFYVWTPDISGAVIGSGESREDAVQNTISNLRETITELEHYESCN